MLNRNHAATTIWNFDPNFSLLYVTQVSLPKMFQIVATWLVFSTEELCAYIKLFFDAFSANSVLDFAETLSFCLEF